MMEWTDAVNEERGGMLAQALDSVASNSLFTELALFHHGDRIKVVPYHGGTLSGVEGSTDEVVLVRPRRASGGALRRFAGAITTLEGLLNDRAVSERRLEAHLRAHLLFMRGLNYGDIYHQVVLPRTGAADLIPDVIAEPIDSDWADIVDLKLPSQKVLVGSENRASLASGLHQAAAQLREYAAFFDDRSVANQVERRYGFRCYKPRMVVIVGRNPRGWSEEQRRRAMTSYPELEIVTYDRLLEASRRMLLL